MIFPDVSNMQVGGCTVTARLLKVANYSIRGKAYHFALMVKKLDLSLSCYAIAAINGKELIETVITKVTDESTEIPYSGDRSHIEKAFVTYLNTMLDIQGMSQPASLEQNARVVLGNEAQQLYLELNKLQCMLVSGDGVNEVKAKLFRLVKELPAPEAE